MTIEFSCRCGHRMKLPEKYAGIRVRCSRCQAPLQVPKSGDRRDTAKAPLVGPRTFDVTEVKTVAGPKPFEVIQAKVVVAPKGLGTSAAKSEAPPIPVPAASRRDDVVEEAILEWREEREQWLSVRMHIVGIGIALILGQFMLILASMLAFYCARTYATYEAQRLFRQFGDTDALRQLILPRNAEGGFVPNHTASVTALVIVGLGLTGITFCLLVPRLARARIMAVTNLGFQAASLGVVPLLLLFPHNLFVLCAFIIFWVVLQFGTWVSFMFFLTRLGHYLKRPYLETENEKVIRLGLAWWGGNFLIPILVLAMPYVFLIFSIVIGLTMLILAITFSVQYIRLMADFWHELS